jgi:outer membrane protein OmpA-like peptidoglycan-associated protein
MKCVLAILSACLFSGLSLYAQQQSQSQSGSVINIHVSRTIHAVNYHNNTSTDINFEGTALMPRAAGKAKVDAKGGRVAIKSEFDNMEPPSSFGPPYLTFVLWAISPEGRPNNLGELVLDGKKSKIDVTTRLQTFGLMVTAEPYFAVTLPSDVVVLQNVVAKNTKGAVSEVDANFELLQRGRYDHMHLQPLTPDPKAPLALYEARNAVRIAEAEEAPKYAPESWAKAQAALLQAEDYQKRKQKQPTLTASRNAVQAAEDSRSIATKRAEDERIAQQQQASAQAAADARAQQEAEAARAAQAKAQQEAESQQRAQAEAAAAEADKQRAEADAQRQAEALRAQQAADQQKQAQQQAEAAQQQAQRAEQEKEQLRAKLLAQFNQILETKDTPRGLVANMSDVLFDTSKYSLKDPAKIALARFSGIVMNYPGLKLQIEGYTDSRGSDEFNQKLSEDRATAVRNFLVSQGVNLSNITALGLGPNNPVADNSTTEGRQKNRRVEIIVSGDVIGTQVGQTR